MSSVFEIWTLEVSDTALTQNVWIQFHIAEVSYTREQKPYGVTVFLVLLTNVDRTVEQIVGILALYCFTYIVMTCHQNACASFSFYLCSSSVFLNLTFLLSDVCRIA